MNRIIKRIALMLVALTAILCVGIFAACGDNTQGGQNSGNVFSVTVLYPDGTAVNGVTDGTGGVDSEGNPGTEVKVQWCNVENGVCTVPETLSTDGKASKELEIPTDGNSYHVLITGLPTGYTFEDNNYVTQPGNVTITLIAK